MRDGVAPCGTGHSADALDFLRVELLRPISVQAVVQLLCGLCWRQRGPQVVTHHLCASKELDGVPDGFVDVLDEKGLLLRRHRMDAPRATVFLPNSTTREAPMQSEHLEDMLMHMSGRIDGLTRIVALLIVQRLVESPSSTISTKDVLDTIDRSILEQVDIQAQISESFAEGQKSTLEMVRLMLKGLLPETDAD